MKRLVKPELLDALPTGDPRAIRSRWDLRRLNRIMAHARLIREVLAQGRMRSPLGVVADLGAGDGTFLLSVARVCPECWTRTATHLVDAKPCVAAETIEGFKRLGMECVVHETPVLPWLQSNSLGRFDVVVANLFLHHLPSGELAAVFEEISRRTRRFIACDPRRGWFALAAARCVGLVGGNVVTRHDAVASVRAGFRAAELSALWPGDDAWKRMERPAGWFSHLFVAARDN